MEAGQCPKINQDIDQRVAPGNGLKGALMRMVNAQGMGLSVDAFSGGALLVERAIRFSVPIEPQAHAMAAFNNHFANSATALTVEALFTMTIIGFNPGLTRGHLLSIART